jgi:16S rRNA (guanine527-N7)-methyltransferase
MKDMEKMDITVEQMEHCRNWANEQSEIAVDAFWQALESMDEAQKELIIENLEEREILKNRLIEFLIILAETNEIMNLVSKGDMQNIGYRHVLDSLTPLLFHKMPKNTKILDIGSGGGFPSIVLKLARPDLGMTLVESTNKKAQFLEKAGESLSFSKFNVQSKRIEELEEDRRLHEFFDIATCRALASPVKCLKYASDYIKSAGHLILFLGRKDVEEFKQFIQYLVFRALMPNYSKRLSKRIRHVY